MNLKVTNARERDVYRAGYAHGKKEGLQKAVLLIQLMLLDCNSFKENILQNSEEAIELRKIFTEEQKNE